MQEIIRKTKNLFTENFSIISILMPAAIYFLGYIKYFLLLRKLEIELPVNDIFPLLSIFISGISISISYLYIPVFSFCVFFILKKYRSGTLKMTYNILLILCCATLPLFIKDFMFAPFNIPVLLYIIVLVTIYFLLDSNWKALPKVIALWVICISISYYIFLPTSNDSYFKLHINSNVNQDSGISGYIITPFTLSPNSVATDFYSQSEDCFQTYGILLSSHEGNFYFYTNKRLYIVPTSSVLLFNQYLHE